MKQMIKEIMKEIIKEIRYEINNLIYNHKVKLITIILLIVLFPISLPMCIVAFFAGMIIGLIEAIWPGKKEYDKSEYKAITKEKYINVIFDKCKASEYDTWKVLNEKDDYKRILINLYIPKDNGEFSEIDFVLINKYRNICYRV